MSIDPLLKLAPSSCAPHPHVVVLLVILLRAILFGHLVWGTISRCSRFYSSGRPIQLGPGPGPPGYTGCSLVPTPSGLAQLSGVSPRVNGSDEGEIHAWCACRQASSEPASSLPAYNNSTTCFPHLSRDTGVQVQPLTESLGNMKHPRVFCCTTWACTPGSGEL